MDNKSERAYLEIKRKIIFGELLPMSEVSEEQLQKELNISRTPIREALQRLAKEHFVLIYPRRGTIVSDITLDVINSIYEIRLLNEPYIARSACRYISQKSIDELYQAFSDTSLNLEDREKRDYYIEMDRKLHNMLTEHTNNFMLKDLFQIVNDHNHRIRIMTSKRNMNYQRSIEEHLEILRALRDRDEDRIEQSVRNHILTAKKEAFEYYY